MSTIHRKKVGSPIVRNREISTEEEELGIQETKVSLLDPSPNDSRNINSSMESQSRLAHHFSPISADLQESLAKDFHARKQLAKILVSGFIMWIRSAVILLIIGLILWRYHLKAVMSIREKNVFNTLMVGTSLALGLNISASLYEMTRNIRWYFLSNSGRSIREVDTLIQADVGRLDTYRLGPRPWASFIGLVWLLVNIGCQVGVACLGLTYSIDNQERVVLVSDGKVNITDFSNFYPLMQNQSSYVPTDNSDWAANNFGNVALFAAPIGTVDEAPKAGDAYNSVNSKMWSNYTGSRPYWEYRFLESSSTAEFIPGSPPVASVYTNRTIRAYWNCGAYKVLLPSGNGDFRNITYVVNDATNSTSSYEVPVVRAGQTTFWSGVFDEGTPRSAQVYAFEPDYTDPWFYNCNITVTEVANATHANHTISDAMAQTAGWAIALGGLKYAVTNSTLTHRAQRYPQAAWGYGGRWRGRTYYAGGNIARFAIGAISVTDKYNPRITMDGESPGVGVVLSIGNTAYLIAIFTCVGGVQLVFLLITSLLANKVVITDDSPVAIARLLAPTVMRLGNAGSIASGKDLCEVLEQEDRMRVVYTVHRDEDGGARRRVVLSDEEKKGTMGDGIYY